MARGDDRDFVEALARGLDVITCFSATATRLTVSDVAARTGLARPTTRRLLLTLQELGYVHSSDGEFSLTTKTLELGTAYIATLGIWEIARPHMQALVEQTGESTSIAQLDGSDIVYVARVPVAKIISIAVHIGTRFPAAATSMGKVLLAELDPAARERVLALPSNSGVVPAVSPSIAAFEKELAQVRKRGWALSDERLARGIRSVAAPLRSADGTCIAAINVTVHAAETSIETLTEHHLPLLLDTAAAISRDWGHMALLPLPDPLHRS